MNKTIFVPQGYCAKITPNCEIDYDIGGLYTDNFTTSNIVALIGRAEIALIYIDYPTLAFDKNRLKAIIKGIKGLEEVVIISNENKTVIKKQLVEFIGSFVKRAKILVKEVEKEYIGVYLSFEKQNNNLHPNIKKISTEDKISLDLIHHPQEHRLLAVQKIGQVIGIYGKAINRNFPQRNLFIFKTYGWEPISKEGLEIDISNEHTANEMNEFKKGASYFEIINSLIRVIENTPVGSTILEGSRGGIADGIARYMEDYLNNFKYASIFKRNIEYFINNYNYRNNIPLKSDKEFINSVKQLVSQEEDIFEEIKLIYDKYMLTASTSRFKDNFSKVYEVFADHYEERKKVDIIRKQCLERQRESIRLSEEIIKIIESPEAKSLIDLNLTWEAIKVCTYSHLLSSSILANQYYNCSILYDRIGMHDIAEIYYNISIEIREKYSKSNLTADIYKNKEYTQRV